MCKTVFLDAAKCDIKPVRLYPRCHPRARLDVYVNVDSREVTICCARCDQAVCVVKAKGGRRAK